MTGSAIRDLVLIKLEEYSPYLNAGGGTNNGLLAGGDVLGEIKPIYEYIDKSLDSAANEVLMLVPIYRVEPTDAVNHSDTAGTAWTLTPIPVTNDTCGDIYLPIDFLRLHTLKMGSWQIPLHNLTTCDNAEYEWQFSKYTRGIPQKPVAVYEGDGLSWSGFLTSASTYQIFYSLKTDATTLLTDTALMTAIAALASGTNAYVYDVYGRLYKYASSAFVRVNNASVQYYTEKKGVTHSISQLLYIPSFKTTSDYDNDVAELIALNCAYKVMSAYGNANGIALVEKEMQTIIQTMSGND